MKIDIKKVVVGSKIHVSESLKTYFLEEVAVLAGKWVTVASKNEDWDSIKVKEYKGNANWGIDCFDMIDGVEYE